MRAKTTHRTAVTVLFFTIVLCLLAAGGCKNASKRAYRAYSVKARPKAPLPGADSPYQGEMSRRDKRGRDAVSEAD